ncbi:molybdopterin-binding domain-containing protein [Nocardioides scoriae]|uniref:hypothetical protein n=1 Tax=Nocardioides scoriae TaxID=642780 RepID=UPI0012F9CD67|nr:hypothetical protein [Nocardioides scoriae]
MPDQPRDPSAHPWSARTPDLVLVAGVEVEGRPRLREQLRADRAAGTYVVQLDPLDGAAGPGGRRRAWHETLRRDWRDELVQLRAGSDQLLLAWLSRLTLEAGATDALHVARRTTGLEAFRARLETLVLGDRAAATGVPDGQLEALARRYRRAGLVHAHWGRGVTGQRDAAAVVAELVGLLALRGHPVPGDPAVVALPDAPVAPVEVPRGSLLLAALHDHHALVAAARHDVRRDLLDHRWVSGRGSRVVLVDAVDRETLGIAEEEVLDVVAAGTDGDEGRVRDVQVVDAPLARGSVVASVEVVADLLGPDPEVAPMSRVVVLERHPDAD